MTVVPATEPAPELALQRLVAQRVAGPPLPSAAAAVRHLLAAQGQDLPGALLSVALRTADGTRGVVEAALDAGEVVRSWPMRGTLHLVAAQDLGFASQAPGANGRQLFVGERHAGPLRPGRHTRSDGNRRPVA